MRCTKKTRLQSIAIIAVATSGVRFATSLYARSVTTGSRFQACGIVRVKSARQPLSRAARAAVLLTHARAAMSLATMFGCVMRATHASCVLNTALAAMTKGSDAYICE